MYFFRILFDCGEELNSTFFGDSFHPTVKLHLKLKLNSTNDVILNVYAFFHFRTKKFISVSIMPNSPISPNLTISTIFVVEKLSAIFAPHAVRYKHIFVEFLNEN